MPVSRYLVCLVIIALAFPCCSRRLAAARKPNVIIIYTDDQGSIDLGCYGSPDLKTPHMDRLADQGVLFTQFYAAAPVCSPSRAGLLTGRFPVRAGVPGNVSSQRGKPGMPTEQITIAEALQTAGYATAHIGKWHLGYTDATMPNGQGFDYTFGHMGGCIDNYSHFFYWNGPNRHDLWRQGKRIRADGEYFPALMVAEAGQFIERHREQPFFLYFAMNAPHYPYQGHAQWLRYYQQRDVPHPRTLYNAFVSSEDDYIGQLMAKLEQLGIREETIVILQSDHGHSTEQRAHFGGGSAGPYRGAKFSLFEGGIRVPAIISWPQQLPQGAVRHQMGHSCDWLPTLAAYCNADVSQLDLDGTSLVEVIADDRPSPHDVLHWSIGNSWAVRSGKWKLLSKPRDTSQGPTQGPVTPLFLANLADDISERTNLAESHPDIVNRLAALHQQWWRAARNSAGKGGQ
ncbi:MAG: sulfatase-like hydrolase/transferase [Pirellulales bacterium]|nr:sulfatase-like hydrolase/transferase [Pirellulales bacterium]